MMGRMALVKYEVRGGRGFDLATEDCGPSRGRPAEGGLD